MKAQEGNEYIKPVFKAKDGTQFYAHHNPYEISAKRALSAEESLRYAELCISKKELAELISESKKAVNINQDFVKAFSIIQEIDFRLKYFHEERSLFDLCSLYYFIEGEDVIEPHETFNNKKRKLYEEDETVRAFFLSSAQHLLKHFGEKPVDDLLTYLEEMKSLSQRIYRFIPKSSWTKGEGT